MIELQKFLRLRTFGFTDWRSWDKLKIQVESGHDGVWRKYVINNSSL